MASSQPTWRFEMAGANFFFLMLIVMVPAIALAMALIK